MQPAARVTTSHPSSLVVPQWLATPHALEGVPRRKTSQSTFEGADSVHGSPVQFDVRTKQSAPRRKTHGVFTWPVEHRLYVVGVTSGGATLADALGVALVVVVVTGEGADALGAGAISTVVGSGARDAAHAKNVTSESDATEAN